MVKDTATEHAKAVFNTLDTDGSGELTEEEFVKGFLKDLEKVEALSPWDDYVYLWHYSDCFITFVELRKHKLRTKNHKFIYNINCY